VVDQVARLTREVGIARVRINRAGAGDPGQGIIRAGRIVRDVGVKLTTEQRIREASEAAQALNFERDPDGNVLAPQLPESEGGFFGPSIFDQEYTKQVLTRYKQQVSLDGVAHLQKLAEVHRLDPDGYQLAAQSYIDATADKVLPAVRGDAKTELESRAVTHFNFIVRQRSEFDFQESGNTHKEHMNQIHDNLISLISSGADNTLVALEYTRWFAELEAGADSRFYDRSNLISAPQVMQKAMAAGYLARELSVLTDDPASNAQALARLKQFEEGKGTVKIVVDDKIQELPISEVFETPAERQAITEAAVGMLRSTVASEGFIENEHFDRQSKDFYRWWLPHLVESTSLGQNPNMVKLQNWFDKAQAEDNQQLMSNIATIMTGIWNSNSGGEGTRFERALFRADRRREVNRNELARQWYSDNGLTPETATDEQNAELMDSIDRSLGGLGVPQGAEAAENIDSYYHSRAGYRIPDPMNPDIPLQAIEQYISDTGMDTAGIIGWDFSLALNPVFDSADNQNPETLNRALEIGRMIYDNPALRNNMQDSTAFGRHGAALKYIYDNYAPSRINAATAAKIIEKFSDPGYTPHKEWSALHSEDREKISEMMENYLEGRYLSLNRITADGFEVPRALATVAPNLADIPAAMEQQLFAEMRSSAGFIDPNNVDAFNRHMDMVIDRVSSDFGWIPSRMAYSEPKFTATHDGFFASRPVYGFAQYAPEAFYRHGDSIDFEMMDEIEKDFQALLDEVGGDTKLVAGENAALQYNAARSVRTADGRIIPAYNIMIIQENGAPLFLTNNAYVYGDASAINFESTRIKLEAKRAKEKRENADRDLAIETERRLTAHDIPISP
jgi:hypothetical protein